MPCEPLDAPEDLPKERRCQVALGQLQDEVSSVPNEAAPGLEQALLQARQGPALDGGGQNQPAQQITDVVRDDPEEQPHLIGPEAVAGEAGPVGFGLALFYLPPHPPPAAFDFLNRALPPLPRG